MVAKKYMSFTIPHICLKTFGLTLESMIHGSGRHRNNPDVMQFRSSFRHIAVDKLFVGNSGRRPNCESDLDHVVLDILSLSNLLKSRPHDDVHYVSSSQVDHEVSCKMTSEDDFDLQDFSEIPDFVPLEIENVLGEHTTKWAECH